MKRQLRKYLPAVLAGLSVILLAAVAACGSGGQTGAGPEQTAAVTTTGGNSSGNGGAAREGGNIPQADAGDEESGQQFGLGDSYDAVRAGARLRLSYDAAAKAFRGTVEKYYGGYAAAGAGGGSPVERRGVGADGAGGFDAGGVGGGAAAGGQSAV